MFIPIGTDRPLRRSARVTQSIILTCALVFALQWLLPKFANFELTDSAMLNFPIAVVEGTLHHLSLEAFSKMDLWQFITYQFLHADILHIGFNMLFLWVFGQAVEDRLGRVGFVAFYLAAGIGAALAHGFFAEPIRVNNLVVIPPVLGASGSVAGVSGAFLVLFPRTHIRIISLFGLWAIPAWVLIAIYVVMDLFWLGAGSKGIAYEAHLGGYAFGAAVAATLLWTRILKREPMYDLISIWQHNKRRREYRDLVRKQRSGGWVDEAEKVRKPSPTNRKAIAEEQAREAEREKLDNARRSIAQALEHERHDEAIDDYRALAAEHPEPWLGRDLQLALANALYRAAHHADAADTYEQFIAKSPADNETPQIRILLAMIYARQLNDPVRARAHLDEAAKRSLPTQAESLAAALRNEIA